MIFFLRKSNKNIANGRMEFESKVSKQGFGTNLDTKRVFQKM